MATILLLKRPGVQPARLSYQMCSSLEILADSQLPGSPPATGTQLRPRAQAVLSD